MKQSVACNQLQKKQKPKELDYSSEIKDKIVAKRRLRRAWQNTRHPDDKNKFNTAARELKGIIQKAKHDMFQEYIQGLSA